MSHLESPFRRVEGAVLRASDWPYPINSVFNAGAVRLRTGPDAGQVVLLCRVEDRSGVSHLCVARSHTGLGDWQIDATPTLSPSAEFPEERWGIEDPRVVWLEELERYAVTYTCYSELGPAVSLALTDDFREFDCMGMICAPENKDAALFPLRFNGQWQLLHRPVSSTGAAHIWISSSPDLIHWGNPEPLIRSRGGSFWDAAKVGLATPPIPVAGAWLVLYHGVKETVSGSIYRVGAALLDAEQPTRVTARSNSWCLAPQTAGERSGDVGNVVFPCGHIFDPSEEELWIYYGAADSELHMARARVRDLVAWVRSQNTIVEQPSEAETATANSR